MRWIYAAAMAIAAALAPLPPATAAGLFDLTWSEPAPGVFVGVRPEPLRYPVVANTVIVTGATGALIYDPGGYAAQAEAVLAQVRRVAAAPVTHLVVSQWHGDKSRGLKILTDAYPRAATLASEFTRKAVAAPLLQNLFAGERDGGVLSLAAQVRDGLAKNVFIDGTPLHPDETAYWTRFVADAAEHEADLKRLVIVPPAQTVSGTMTVDLGGRTVELIETGPANTKGDVVLWLPQDRILAASDLVVAPVPYGFNAYPRAWTAALDRLAALEPRLIVPGHGEPQSDLTFVRELQRALAAAIRAADDGIAAGRSLDAIQRDMDWTEARRPFTGGEPIRERFFDLFFSGAIVASAYNEAKGIEQEALSPDPPSR